MASNNIEDAASVVSELHRLLKFHYGYDSFRPLQLEAIQATLSGNDVLLLLPTGGGKSLAFQLAPLYTQKIAVIVTPLLALAKDQVESANDKYNIEAASWSSETPEPRKKSIANELLGIGDDPTLRLLYVTPEALQTERLRSLLISAHHLNRLCSLVVDEAHCVSEWGHSFRKDYLEIGRSFRTHVQGLPIIAVTATATPQVRNNILELLGMKRDSLQLQSSFNRPNIQMEVRMKEVIGDGSEEAVLQDVIELIKEREGQCGIVYCRLRATCDKVARELCNEDIDAAAYHAGLDTARRNKIQQGWSEGSYTVVVATIAFGMGIDVANVRFVIHFDPPASLEGYYQESGRAGRDGLPSLSVLYSSNEELLKARGMERGNRQGATASVAGLIQQARCRRRALLAHFHELRSEPCDASKGELLCDVCRDPRKVRAELESVESKLAATAAAAAEAIALPPSADADTAEDGDDDDDDDDDDGGGNVCDEEYTYQTLKPASVLAGHKTPLSLLEVKVGGQQPLNKLALPFQRKRLPPPLLKPARTNSLQKEEDQEEDQEGGNSAAVSHVENENHSNAGLAKTLNLVSSHGHTGEKKQGVANLLKLTVSSKRPKFKAPRKVGARNTEP